MASDGRGTTGAMLRRIAPFMAVAALAVDRARGAGGDAGPCRCRRSGSTSRSCSSPPTGPSPASAPGRRSSQREGVPYEHVRRLQRPEPGRDADRRRPGRLRRQPRVLQRGHPRHRRPRPQRGQRRRHHQLPLRPQRRRVGERSPSSSGRSGSASSATTPRPSPAHGLNTVGGATQDGNVGTLTPPARPRSPTSRDRCRSPTTTRRWPRRSATPRRRSTRRTGRPSSPGPTAPPTSGSTRIPTTGARRWS